MNKVTIFSIIFIFLLLFESIAPLIKINAYENIKNSKNYEDKFVFSIEDKNIEIPIESQYKFYPIEVEGKNFLIGIINVDNDNDEISKEIARGVFLGKNNNEIKNEIIRKYNKRLWKYKGKNVYNYSLNNENIIIDFDSLEIHKEAKGGIAIVFKVINSTTNEPIQEGFYFSSKSINDGTSNKGRIRIRDAIFDLPFSLKLNKTKYPYEISYETEEGYEFINWSINGGYVTYVNKNSSYAKLYITSDKGNITAYYRNVKLPENLTYNINITGTGIVNFKSISINDNSTGKGEIWIYDKIPLDYHDKNVKHYSLYNDLKINLTKGKKYYLYYKEEEGYELYNILAYGGIIEPYAINILGFQIYKYYIFEIIEDISNVIILYKKKEENKISKICNVHLSSEDTNVYLNNKNKGKIIIYKINLEYKITPPIGSNSYNNFWEISIKDFKEYPLTNDTIVKLEKQYLDFPISPYIIKYIPEEGYEFDYFFSIGGRILSYKDLEKLFIGNVFLKNIPENSYFLLIDEEEVWINAYYHGKDKVYGKFKLKSIGNDGSNNKGTICINDKEYPLLESSQFGKSLDSSDKKLLNLAKNYIEKYGIEVKLAIGDHYTISYLPDEGYDFDKFEINGGEIKNKLSRLSYDIIIEKNEGEIIAYYKKIRETTSITNSTTTTSIKSNLKEIIKIELKSKCINDNSENKGSIYIYNEDFSGYYSLPYSKEISGGKYNIEYKEKEGYEFDHWEVYNGKIIESISKNKNIILIENSGTLIAYYRKIITSTTKATSITTIKTISTIYTISTRTTTTKSITSTTSSIYNYDIDKHILNNLKYYEENYYKSSTTITTSLITSTTSKSSSSTIITYTTKTITTSTTSINTKTSSTSYDIDKHIINNLNYYNSVNNIITTTNTIYYTVKGNFATYTTALYTYTTTKKITSSTKTSNTISGGGGSPKALLRDSLLFNEELYKEFLKKIEENKENKKLPMKYIIYKISPLRIENQDRSFDGTMVCFKVRTIVKNYDSNNRYCLLSTKEIGKETNEVFLTKPNVNDVFHVYSLLHKINIKKVIEEGGIDARTEISFWLRPNEKYDKDLQVFFTEDDSLSIFGKNEKHEIGIYLYVKGEDGNLKLIDVEPKERKEKGNNLLTISIIGILKGVGEFAITSLPTMFMMYCPKSSLIIVPILTLYWAEYYKNRIIDQELDWKIKEISFKDLNSFIDIFAIRKIIEKEYSSDIVKQINNYIQAAIISIVDFYDPSNIACSIIANDLSVSIAGQINEWYKIVNNPNIKIEDKASIIGRIAGLIFSISFAGSVYSSKSFRDFIDKTFGNKFGIINSKLGEIWKINSKIGEKTIDLLIKAIEKIRFIEDTADEFIDLIKIVLKHGEKESYVNEAIEYAIKRIDGGSIDLSELTNEVAIEKFKIIKAKISGAEDKDKMLDIHKSIFEKILGKVPKEGTYGLFEVLTENGEGFLLFRKFGTLDEVGRFQFSAESIYEKLGTKNIFIKVREIIETPNDFCKLFKENVKEIDLDSIVRLKSLNEIEIVNKEGKAITINLKDVSLHWISDESKLGIKGKMLAQYGEDENVAICYDGKDASLEILFEEEGRMHGRKITKIELTDEWIRFNYKLSEKEKRPHSIYFIKEPKIKIYGNIIECIPNKGSLEAYIESGSNNVRRGAIGEIWTSYVCKYIPNCEVKRISLGKGSREFADLHLLWEGEICPHEVTVFKYYVGISKEELKEEFKRHLKIDIIEGDLYKDFYYKVNYINSKKGLGTVIGIPIDENGNPIGRIDVLTVEVPIVENVIGKYKIIFKPSYYTDE
jgi:hypothetical protein